MRKTKYTWCLHQHTKLHQMDQRNNFSLEWALIASQTTTLDWHWSASTCFSSQKRCGEWSSIWEISCYVTTETFILNMILVYLSIYCTLKPNVCCSTKTCRVLIIPSLNSSLTQDSQTMIIVEYYKLF